MSIETTWENRAEWATERGAIEVKWKRVSKRGLTCDAEGCTNPAIATVMVGKEINSYGTEFEFCEEHDSDEFALNHYEGGL